MLTKLTVLTTETLSIHHKSEIDVTSKDGLDRSCEDPVQPPL